ncbi:unnamed protein product [Sphagnum balticum]
MSELKVVETIATCVETDSREVDEKLERESCLNLNVRFVNNNGVHIYIYCNKDPESLILNRTQVVISSHSLLLLQRHGTCCSRFQRPDAGPRYTIDVVTLPHNHIISFWSRYVTSQGSGVLQVIEGWSKWLKDITCFQSMLRDVQITRSVGNACSEQSHTSSK